MSPITLNAVRYGIPAVLFIAGMVVWGIGSVAAGAMFISAATAVLLLNFLFRIGVEGDQERDRVEAARRYFDEHGRWPGEELSRHMPPAAARALPGGPAPECARSRSRPPRPRSARARAGAWARRGTACRSAPPGP